MRIYLKEGTLIKVSGGVIYKITGEPIGVGGGSVTYPALRMLPSGDGYRTGQINYAVKECYPESEKYSFVRNVSGEICASANGASVSGQNAGFMPELNVESMSEPNAALESEADTPETSELSDVERQAIEAITYLERAKCMQSQEETVTGQIYNHAFRLTPVLETYSHVEISLDEGGQFHPAANMISIMESLSGKGRSLKNYLKERKSLKAGEAFEVIRQVLLAVSEVHRSGFLHLDIQDGNIFIKGVLDKNDCMLSLIDFGAARALLADGMCAEITDRVLFSTRGFTAPEILLKNDGHLRLGKQADIYSIGCLLLVLLTGHRYATAELIANKTGRFIPRFAIRKTGCPSHLIEKMQGIIAKALKTDVTTRYSSTEDMLADVEELLALLAPLRDPLSASEFDAFICYAHGEKDSAAAIALRNALERYKSGFHRDKKIKRVFLDEGELSSCADFGERINAALKNSKWLIVLCSEHTRESKWVNEEIKLFLRYHDKSRILAVLIEGEPGEVYPEELIRNGINAENLLAADARSEDKKGIVRKIKGNVRLQIAAPILNTTFDALKQRKRLYAVQRAFAGTAIVLCALVGFFAYAALKAEQIAEREKQIAKQAEIIVQEQTDKLESQATLLAQQAQDAYTEHDYSNAIKLALSSMELSEKNPVRQSNMKRLLILCLNLYTGSSQFSSEFLIKPNGMISDEEGSDFLGYYLNSDGSRLFSVSDNRFCVWDTSDCSIISVYEAENLLRGYEYDRDKTNLIEEQSECILWNNSVILCWDYESGKTIWENELNSTCTESVLLSENHDRIYIIASRYLYNQIVVQEIDSVNGEVLNEQVFAKHMSFIGMSSFDLSTDNRYIAFMDSYAENDRSNSEEEYTESVSYIEDSSDTVDKDSTSDVANKENTENSISSKKEMLCVIDLKQSSMKNIYLGDTYQLVTNLTKDVSFIDESHILVSEYKGLLAPISHLDDYQNAYFLYPKYFTITCYNYRTGDSIWQYDTEYNAAGNKWAVTTDLRGLHIPHIYRTEIDHVKVIVAIYGSTFLMLNEVNGECIENLLLDSTILSLEERDKAFQIILDNGYLGVISKKLDIGEISIIEGFPENMLAAEIDGKNYYIVNKSNRNVIAKYERGNNDDGYTKTIITNQSVSEYINSLPGDDQILETAGKSIEITGYNSFNIIGDVSYKVVLDKNIKHLSFTPDGNRILVCSMSRVSLYNLDGTIVTEADLPDEFYLYGSPVKMFFPEPGTCLCVDGLTGCLFDINESGIVLLKHYQHAVGFDHETNEVIICDEYQEEGNGVTVGRFRYYTGEEIRERAKDVMKLAS